MCLEMQGHSHITGNNLIPVSIPLVFVYDSYMTIQEFTWLLAMEGKGRDRYGDQIVTYDVGVALHSKIHPMFM